MFCDVVSKFEQVMSGAGGVPDNGMHPDARHGISRVC
jgi:hypothetical protein